MLRSPVLFSLIGHDDKVMVNMVNVGVIIPGGMIKMCLGQVSVWNFPIFVKFQTDSCLECGSMIIYD